MEGCGKIRLYVSNVCFRNMGRQDVMFGMFGGSMRQEFGAYLLCCAYADSSATYRSIVENFADNMQTGIVEMCDLTEGNPAMLDSMKHLWGVYTDGNLYTFGESPEQAAKPYRKPGKMPSWQAAYVKFRDGAARRYYAPAPEGLLRKLLHLFAARYGLQLADIVSVREAVKPSLRWRIWMRLAGTKPGRALTERQFQQLKNSHQDMGLYRF